MNLLKRYDVRGTKLACFLMTILYLPFTGKAFHIDDPLYIDLSHMLGWNPLNAIKTGYNCFGHHIKDMLPYENTHPFLIPYYIKISRALFGNSELSLHFSFLIFPVIFLLAFLYMWRHWKEEDESLMGSITGILVISTPVFLVNAHNIMTDIPTAAFLMLSLFLFILAIDKRKNTYSYAGGVIFAMASMSSYQVLALPPAIVFYAFLKKNFNRHLIVGLAIPYLVLAVYMVLIYIFYGIVPIFKSNFASFFSDMFISADISQEITMKTLGVFAFIGMAMFFPVIFRFILSPSIRDTYAIVASAIIAALCSYAGSELNSWRLALFATLATFGLFSLYVSISRPFIKNRSDKAKDIFIASWVIIVILYNIFTMPFSAARYILPAVPVLYIAILIDVRWPISTFKKLIITGILILSLIFGAASAYSDYSHASVYRDFAFALKNSMKLNNPNNSVWYTGEWGIRYYMDEIGGRYLLLDSNEPKPGDFIVIPEMCTFWNLSPLLLNRVTRHAMIKYMPKLPLRLFSFQGGAGFYNNNVANILRIPFSFSYAPYERFLILKVIK